MKYKTLEILQDGFENSVTIHRVIMTPNAGRYCDEPELDSECSTKKEPGSEEDSDGRHIRMLRINMS